MPGGLTSSVRCLSCTPFPNSCQIIGAERFYCTVIINMEAAAVQTFDIQIFRILESHG